MRNGKLEIFREDAYAEPPKVQKIKDNLVENFGYGKIEARRLAYEVLDNLERYLRIEEQKIAQFNKLKELSDNRTVEQRRPKSILEIRAEAKNRNI